MHVHTHVREDAIVLYGFATAEERRCFEALLGAHGVGPVAGPGHPVAAVARPTSSAAVLDDDLDALCTVPGVGPQDGGPAAARADGRASSCPSSPATGCPAGRRQAPSEARGEVRAALVELGYGARRDPAGARRRAGRGRPSRRCCVRRCASWRAPGERPARGAVAVPGVGRRAVAPAADRATASPRPVDPLADPAELAEEARLRPRRLEEFVGQAQLTEHLQIVLEAARRREQPVDHLLFAGPPGLGKTSLAGIVAAEMGVGLRITSGPALVRAGDLAALLTDLQDGDVLFIDEIHRLPRPVEEILYPAMEDFQLDILIGKGPTARSHPPRPAPLHPGGGHHPDRAAHRPAARPVRLRRAPRPLRRRRPAGHRDPRRRGSSGVEVDGRGRAADRRRGPGARPGSPTGCCGGCATSSRCGPRGPSPAALATEGLELFGVDELGLDKVDRAILDALCRRFDGRPVGPGDPGPVHRRGARHRRGRLRALPAPAGPPHAHAPGAGGHAAGLRPPGR